MEKHYVRQHLERRALVFFSAAFCALHSEKDGFSQKDMFFQQKTCFRNDSLLLILSCGGLQLVHLASD